MYAISFCTSDCYFPPSLLSWQIFLYFVQMSDVIKPEYDIHHLIFEPGSYNSWHIHPDADQVLLILDGEGFYQEEGKPKRLIKRGDVINTPANVKHWHGATQDSKLVHLSVTTKNGKNHIEWKELVKSNEYNL